MFMVGRLASCFLGRILVTVTFLYMLICQPVNSVSLNCKFSHQQSLTHVARRASGYSIRNLLYVDVSVCGLRV